MKTVFSALRRAITEQVDTVLVTVLSSTGSAPRGTGAQMLVGPCGLLAGTVGGGAVEGRAIEEAVRLLREGGSTESQSYPLHPSLKDDIGMVCGGDMTLLLSPVPCADPQWQTAVEPIIARLEARQGGIVWMALSGSAAPFITDSGAATPHDGYFPVEMPSVQRVVVFGAGHISRALVPLLRMVDFSVTVYDDRPEFAVSEAFPHAESVLCGSYESIDDTLPLYPDDFIVVLTSGHHFDFEVLHQVLRHDFPYVGVIGSATKTQAVNKRLWAAGIPKEATDRVHTPIGLAIGAVTPEEIAISITGELISVRAALRKQ
ncbi:MAG: xanthine dehydrogenase accessory protein XdhC [Oscillospiraceae bacterium]|nr:xanthine dehydrogenase accessory protein XdhC [Oscillospiraceae bacterium]